jgi:hypothetical protein
LLTDPCKNFVNRQSNTQFDLGTANPGERKGEALRPPHLHAGPTGPENQRAEFACIPRKGDRIELLRPRLGIRLRGNVFYADQLQVLVKWDDGRSESLRAGDQMFRILEASA